MAGHSKWANIKHSKARVDAKKGKIFTKLIREITISAKSGTDANSNPRLRTAIEKAYNNNMTKDTIQRAIKRGAGGEDGSHLDEIRYEGYGPNGVAVMVDCLTDNKNRTAADVRHAFSKLGGNLGTTGSVSYLFTESGIMQFAKGQSEDKIMEIALDHGAEDIVSHEDGSISVYTPSDQLESVKIALEKANIHPEQSEVTFRASTEVTLNEEEAINMLKLIDALEDLDDVQNVYSNANIPDAILGKIS